MVIQLSHFVFSFAGHAFGPFKICWFIRSDKIVTSSFDKTLKLWSVSNGCCLRTFYGHTAEVVSGEFGQSGSHLVSASMDATARVYDVETGLEIRSPLPHSGEVIAAHLNKNENIILTGSFDCNAYVWDLRAKE